jgi:hypothetical protein
LMAQDFTEKITYVDVGTDAWNSNHWIFSPSKFGIDGEYLNFGFYRMPTEYLSKYYADMHGLDYDRNFIPNLIPFDCPMPDIVSIDITDPTRTGYKEMKLARTPNTLKLDFNESYEKNIWLGYIANKRLLSTSSYAIFMDMLNKPCMIYGSVEFHKEWFYRNDIHDIKLF